MNLASTRELHEAFNFTISVGGVDEAKFCTVGPLEASISFTAYREGGSTLLRKDPNEVDYKDITLERGVSQSKLFSDWVNDVIAVTTGLSDGAMIIPQRYVKDLVIYQKDRAKKTIRKYKLFNAFPVDWVAGSWDNMRDEIVIERLVLAYDYFTLT